MKRFLLKLSIIWSVIWLFTILCYLGWFLVDSFLILILDLILLPSGLILLIASFIKLITQLFKRKLSLVNFVPILLVLGMYFFAHRIPSRPAIVFSLHRSEFKEIAKNAISLFQEKRDYSIPTNKLYEDAYIYDVNRSKQNNKGVNCYNCTDLQKTMVIEYIINNFNLPLVYIASDDPNDVYDTCSKGGYPIERLEQNWYVCSRDWN
jgi:hypothetical protein